MASCTNYITNAIGLNVSLIACITPLFTFYAGLIQLELKPYLGPRPPFKLRDVPAARDPFWGARRVARQFVPYAAGLAA